MFDCLRGRLNERFCVRFHVRFAAKGVPQVFFFPGIPIRFEYKALLNRTQNRTRNRTPVDGP
jgi:hypothetical protein